MKKYIILISFFISLPSFSQVEIDLRQPMAQKDNERHNYRNMRLTKAEMGAISTGEQINIDGLRLKNGKTLNLELNCVEPWSASTQFVMVDEQGEHPLPRPQIKILTGFVKGSPQQRAYMYVDKSGYVRGWLNMEGETHAIYPESDEKRWKQLAKNNQTPNFQQPFCATPPPDADKHETYTWNPDSPPQKAASSALLYAKIALECDYEYRQLFGSVGEAADYALALLGIVSCIYESNIDVKLQASYLRIWNTSSDPYDSLNLNRLFEFQNEWNGNMGAVSRNTAVLLSGRHLGGGRAYRGALNNTNAYAVCGNLDGFVSDPFTNFSSLNWDAYVLAHELGHNFNSRHTHCYNPPIDYCWSTQNGCYNDSVVASNGTIMSYCHQVSGGMSNINMNFHPIVQSVLRSYAETKLDAVPEHVLLGYWPSSAINLSWTAKQSIGPYLLIPHEIPSGSYADYTVINDGSNAPEIIFRPGFYAQSGSDVRAHIVSCCSSGATASAPYEPWGVENAKMEGMETGGIELNISPNPFQNETQIEFSLPEAEQNVSITVYDVVGAKVATLADDESFTAGAHQLSFKGKNLPAGIYYCVFQAGKLSISKKIILLK